MELSNITIKAKIMILAGVLIASLLILGIVTSTQLKSIGVELTTIAEGDLKITQTVTKTTLHNLEQAVHFEAALRFGEEMQRHASASEHFKRSLELFEKHGTVVDESIAEGLTLANDLLASAHNEEELKEFKHVIEVLTELQQQHTTFETGVKEIFLSLTQGKVERAYEQSLTVEPLREKLTLESETLLLELENFTQEAARAAYEHEQFALTVTVSIVVIAILFSVFMSVFTQKNINNSLNDAIKVANIIAKGDLSATIKSNNKTEIGRLMAAMEEMQNHLRNLILGMQQSSMQLASASEELAAVSEESSHNTQQQQSETGLIATAMTEMAATVQEVAQNASSTAEAAKQANSETQAGQHVVQDAVTSISNLASGIQNAANVIQELDSSSENIGTVLDVIKDIAEQTNLLALNAAIEAARAGEQGRGFAVVADEVRTLAQRTQESASEIEDMITRLQTGARNAVNVMGDSQAFADDSVTKANEANDSLNVINDTVTRISDMNIQIASIAEEQSAVAQEMDRNIVSVNNLSEQNSSAANQTSAASSELSRLATSLQSEIAKFKV